MRTVSALLVISLFAGLLVFPLYQTATDDGDDVAQEAQPLQRYSQVIDDEASIPRINYVEQVNDIRRQVESRPHIMTVHHNPDDRSHYVEHEVVVRFDPPLAKDLLKQMLQQVSGQVKREFENALIIKSPSMTTHQLMKVFAEHPDSIYAEPNYILFPNRRPNDRLYTRYQWNLPMIGMEESWEETLGNAKVIVAVVDTGIDLKHPDFRDKLVKGYNVLTDNKNPNDDNGHGTHVAGVIAATTNNGEGIAGMSWNSKIMPIKAIGEDGSGTAFDIARGIRLATDNGASVINLSVGNYTPSAALKEACAYAFKRNVVLVAATGNDATDQPGYPAAYPEVIGVSAVDQHKVRADFSNFGTYVDVVAPGVDVPSTYIYSDYAALSGTSMACPHVAALASLIRSVNPTMSNRQVMNVITSTAVDLGSTGKDNLYGHGLISVNRALHSAKPHAEAVDPTPEKVPEAVDPDTAGEIFRGIMERFFQQSRLGQE